MRFPHTRLCLAVLLCIFLSACPVQAEERITSFISRVDVLVSGELAVEETIEVIAEGSSIRRGIYRDFPTSYSGPGGRMYRVSFAVVRVERDGKPEQFHTEKIGNGVRVYMGRKDVLVEHGPHTYVLHYVTNRQLGFFPDFDELYWNVTGNGWSFLIEKAEVTVTIPEAGQIEQYQFYTGRMGERGTDGRLVERSADSITLATTVPLPPRSGFTVVISWPKGIVDEPSFTQRAFWFLGDLSGIAFAGAGLLFLFVYYFMSWQKVGRDPDSGPIIPVFTAPTNLSPAAGRYIMKMAFDEQSFAAVLINMAVKGVLKIEQNNDEYTLNLLTHAVENLTSGELAVRKKLFKSESSIVMNKENGSSIRSAISVLKKILRRDLVNIYFKTNRAKLVPGILISLGILLAIVLSGRDVKTAGFITFWLVGWSGGVAALFGMMVNSWRLARISGNGLAGVKKALASTAFFIPFLGGLIMGTFILYNQVSWPGVLVLLLTLAVNFIFAWLLKAPTVAGRRIMDQLEGLRLYLSVAEKDRLEMFNPPEKTPELFEKMLPWALALDVEQQWAEQFSDLLNEAGSPEQKSPSWYSSNQSLSARNFSSAIGGGLAASIASSSVQPGSSSGFSSGGGGGSSGGGGGGGGGGGW